MKLGTNIHHVSEWALLERFSRSEVKGQGHSKTKCIFVAEAYISTAWACGIEVTYSYLPL